MKLLPGSGFGAWKLVGMHFTQPTTWTLIQDFSTTNSVPVLFDEAGIYFLASHAERAGEAWAFGDPQTGIVIEVWPVQ